MNGGEPVTESNLSSPDSLRYLHHRPGSDGEFDEEDRNAKEDDDGEHYEKHRVSSTNGVFETRDDRTRNLKYHFSVFLDVSESPQHPFLVSNKLLYACSFTLLYSASFCRTATDAAKTRNIITPSVSDTETA